MNKIINIAVPFLAIILGIVAMVAGIVQFANRDKYNTTVIANVVEIREEWENAATEDSVDHLVKTAYIEYEVNGVKYGPVPAPVQKDSYEVGDKMEILYQSEKPEKISDPNVAETAAIFIGLGLIATLAGAFLAFKAVKAK